MEKVPVKYPFDVYIDFAHTPNSLKNVLIEIRKKAQNDVILVFGAAGGKDKSKRPLMGEIAEKYSDVTIVTSDNPRTEDPHSIIEDILAGIKDSHTVIEDRKEAIEYACRIAGKDDIVVIAGKGHEDYQEIKGKKYPMDERVLIREILEEDAKKKA